MKVVIIGGGIAGLSAAHMLLSSDEPIEIDIYESEDIVGGQASSRMGTLCYVEYCWRVFFHTYTNLKSIIKEMGIEGNFIHLHNCFIDRAAQVKPSIVNILAQCAKDKDWELIGRFAKLLCECKARVIYDYDDVNANDYFKRNEFVRFVLGPYLGLDTTKVSLSSFLKFFFSMQNNANGRSQITEAPTQQALFEPWVRYLEGKGVRFHLSAALSKVNRTEAADRIESVVIAGETVTADEYIFACSLKPLNKILEPTCPTFAKMRRLENGLQLYYAMNVNFSKETSADACGQITLIDTPWQLIINKKREWKPDTLSKCHPSVKESWNIAAVDGLEGGLHKKVLSACSKEEAQSEILDQIQNSEYIQGLDLQILNVEDWPQFENDVKGRLTVTNPKFSPNVGNLRSMPLTSQPDDIPRNMHLAGYYVTSTMGGASMESSCETGLQAAQNLLDAKGLKHSRTVKEHHDLCLAWGLLPLVCVDYVLYKLKLPPLTNVVSPLVLILILLLAYAALAVGAVSWACRAVPRMLKARR